MRIETTVSLSGSVSGLNAIEAIILCPASLHCERLGRHDEQDGNYCEGRDAWTSPPV